MDGGLLSLGSSKKLRIDRKFLSLAWKNAGLCETGDDLKAIGYLCTGSPAYLDVAEKLKADARNPGFESVMDVAMMMATLIENRKLDAGTRQNIADTVISRLMAANQGRILFAVTDTRSHHPVLGADIPEKLYPQIGGLIADTQDAISQYRSWKTQSLEDPPHQPVL